MNSIAVEVDNLSVKFGEHLALENVTLQVPQNAYVAIVGPNGAGKSTFLKVMLGLIQPSAGRVKIFGKSPHKLPADMVGYVPQIKTMDRSFPALSIELVMTGLNRQWPWYLRHTDRDKALSAMELVGAKHLAHRPLSRLSGGELQRICLARSIVRKPKLVMLDEPATGIDVVGEADLYRLLEVYQKESGATLFMITHDWHAATHHADHVLLLNKKEIGFGSPASVLTEDNLRRAFGHTGHEHKIKFMLNKYE